VSIVVAAALIQRTRRVPQSATHGAQLPDLGVDLVGLGREQLAIDVPLLAHPVQVHAARRAVGPRRQA
jgi:hypothetical protein